MDHTELIIACKLDPALVRERLHDWKRAVAGARTLESLPHGARLVFPAGNAAELAGLAQAEHECCPFFTFTITIDGGGTTLDITAPTDARPLVDTLLGLDDGD